VKGRVLIIDDEPEIRRDLTVGLTQEDYDVVACPDGISAIHELNQSRAKGAGYDYLVTDIFMPDIDGLKILKVIKSQFPDLPVLVITRFGDDRLMHTALAEKNTGYLDKPFEIPELMSRVRALLKRTSSPTASPQVEASGVSIDTDRRVATRHGAELDLTAKEFDLLAYLVANAGRVISRDEIMEAVWGAKRSTDSNVIEVFVCHIRNKIGDHDNRIIQTIRGVGYFFARG